MKLNKKQHITKDGVVKKNPKKKQWEGFQIIGLYAVKSPEELEDYLEKFSNKEEKRVAYLIYALTWNSMAEVTNKKSNIEVKKMNIFATKTPEQLSKYLENFSGNEKSTAYLVYGLTWNMFANEIKKELKELK